VRQTDRDDALGRLELQIKGDQKKGASKRVTRLPTERLATACWAAILSKRTLREPAPMLDFRPLLRSDMELLSTAYQQIAKQL